MKILPLHTRLPNAPISRRHISHPVLWAGGYSEYRACLRWDFGFTCAFCFLHEADIVLQGTDGLGVSTAEHLVPQSIDDSLANDYTNLVYACRLCNTARKATPSNKSGCSLLDPTKDAWSDHFQTDGDHLLPRDNDPDASYTHKTYNLDDDRKIKRRKFRRVLLEKHISQFLRGQELYQKYLDKAQTERSPEKSLKLLGAAKKIYDEVLSPGRLFLRCYSAIPSDAPQRCRCNTTEMHCLPNEFLRQVIHIEIS